jgi:hypothetical protein
LIGGVGNAKEVLPFHVRTGSTLFCLFAQQLTVESACENNKGTGDLSRSNMHVLANTNTESATCLDTVEIFAHQMWIDFCSLIFLPFDIIIVPTSKAIHSRNSMW